MGCLLSEPPGKPKNSGVGSLSLLQGIFPTQELSWGLLHCRWILYQLSYQGSPIFGATQAFSLVVSSRGSSSCSTQVPYRSGFFCGSWALGCEGFSSCGSQTLEHRPRSCGSRLSCSMACEIFLDQGSSPFLPHCRQILYHLSHQGSPGYIQVCNKVGKQSEHQVLDTQSCLAPFQPHGL